jgi:hypothetical protein
MRGMFIDVSMSRATGYHHATQDSVPVIFRRIEVFLAKCTCVNVCHMPRIDALWWDTLNIHMFRLYVVYTGGMLALKVFSILVNFFFTGNTGKSAYREISEILDIYRKSLFK